MAPMSTVCLFVAFFAGGVELGEDVNTSAFRRLWEATQAQDTYAYPVLQQVLLDMAEQRYVYKEDVRLTAFDYIREIGDRRTLPLLKKIAVIEYVDNESGETTLDLIAIKGALDALVSFGSEDAAKLNLRHVPGNAWVQTTAISNLKELQAWSATPAVEQVFCSKPRIGDNLLVFLRATEFLSTSPEATSTICPCAYEVRSAFTESIEAAASIFYEDLGEALKSLEDRLCAPKKGR